MTAYDNSKILENISTHKSKRLVEGIAISSMLVSNMVVSFESDARISAHKLDIFKIFSVATFALQNS